MQKTVTISTGVLASLSIMVFLVFHSIENNKNQTAPSPDILKSLADLYNINLVELYLLAGYLDKDSLSSYKEGFNNTHLLTAQEKNHIQEAINLFTKGRK